MYWLKMILGKPLLTPGIAAGSTGIERYNLRTNSWTSVGTMTGRRLQFGVAVLDGKLHVVGGRDGLKTLNTVEAYDPATNTWTQLPPMSTHRHGLGELPFYVSCIQLYLII